MDKFSSISAIKDAIAGETYSSSLDVYVTHNKMVYICLKYICKSLL